MSGDALRAADVSDEDFATQLLDLEEATLGERLSPAQRRARLASVQVRPGDPPARMVPAPYGPAGSYMLRAPKRRAAPVIVPPARRSARAPRRAVSRATKGASVAASGADGPPAPPAPGPLVTQQNSGLARHRFLKIVRDLNVPHRWVGRLCVVRLDHLLAALGLGDVPSPAPAAPAWSPEALRLRLLAGSKAGAR